MDTLPPHDQNDNPSKNTVTSAQKLERNKEYRKTHKEQIAQQRKAHYEVNRERILQRQKEHYAKNKEKRDQYTRNYRQSHREQIAQQRREHHQANKEIIAERRKIYTDANKEKIARQNKAYREANKERLAQKNAAKHQRNKEAFALIKAQNPHIGGYQSASMLKRKYNITLFEWYMLLEYQEYKCAVCRRPLNFRSLSRKIAVDHNHSTGEVRGLVHYGCNFMVGIVENPNMLQDARDYVKRNGVFTECKSFIAKLEEDKNE